MYCLINLCYVCLEMKNNLISSVDSSMSVNKELLDMFGYCAHNLAWLKYKRIILICEECCSRLRETYQFLKMWHKNSAVLQNYMDQLNGTTPSNTQTEAELLVHLEDIIAVKCEIKEEQIYTGECEPTIEETQDVFVNTEDSLTIEEHTWKKEEPDEEICTFQWKPVITETENVFVDFEESLVKAGIICKMDEVDDREEYPMDNNSTDSVNNESDSEISANSNTHTTDTDSDSSEFTGKQAAATNKTHSNTPVNKPHTCATCSKSFILKGDLKRHTRIHTGEKPYKCDTCDKCFNDKSNLVGHMRIHTGEKPYKCDRCDKSFTQQSSLVHHMLTHTNEKPFKCDRCDKCFSRKQHLLIHMRTHTGEKPFKCATCSKSFISQADLKRHTRIHTGEKPYKCDKCDKCFSCKSNLVRHMRTHTGEKF